MTAPIARIFLRYLSGILIARGLLSESDGAAFGMDPDVLSLVEAGLGLALSAATELWYAAARRFGWEK